MNQKLTDRLNALPETAAKSSKFDEVVASVVEVERLVLKSNYEDKQSGVTAEFEKREYEVGGPNTRGLSWKLVLFRTIADATFCQMVRVGVHGGNVLVLGQPDNVNATIAIFESLVPVMDTISKSAYTEFADGPKEEGASTPNRTGWINQWLIDAPETLSTAIAESRSKDTSSNSKIANMVAEAESALKEFRGTVVPPKPVKVPKAPKAPKDPNAPKKPRGRKGVDPLATSDSENEDSDNTPDDPEDAYPGDAEDETEDGGNVSEMVADES